MVTEVSSREFVLGKLGGILFNMKEVLRCPSASSSPPRAAAG